MTKIVKYWYFFYLSLIVVVSLSAKLLSNDKPLYCELDGRSCYPAVEEWLTGTCADKQFNSEAWKERQYQEVIWAPIPYTFYQQDFNAILEAPFSRLSRMKHHWLGTDQLGRDIAAGLIHGSTVALLIGLGAILLILVLGLFLGSIAGYFGNKGLRLNVLSALMNGLLVLTTLTYCYVLWPQISVRTFEIRESLYSLLLLLGAAAVVMVIDKLSKKMTTLEFALPIDTAILKTIELFTTIPKLLLLIAVLAVLERSIFTIIAIIGCLGWTTVAKLVRAEILKIKEQEYILAVQLYGLPAFKIIWKHILPNAIAPVLTYACFGTAAAITAEAGLSFLGLGLPANEVSWGSMLSNSREHMQAPWLVLLPGICLFLTIYSLHKVGSYYRTKNQPKKLHSIEAYF